MAHRPIKLKLHTAGHPPPSPLPSATPTTATPKLKLKFSSSIPKSFTTSIPSEIEPPLVVTKTVRKPKKDRPTRISTPTAKKRDFANLSEDELNELPATSTSIPTIKKIKIKHRAPPTTPSLRLKARGKPPERPKGVGYDSEADDVEKDPTIEEEFVLRMIPGEDCDYLRWAIEEKKWGPKSQDGADIRLKFLAQNGRRAVLSIRGHHYAACLVDLPCVIEAMKSWDRRGWWKSADICQILLVLGRITRDEEAESFQLPGKELDKVTWQYAHGLTPPMRWVRKRRFRKRVSNRTIEAVEEEVEKLLQADEESAGQTRYEVLDYDRLSKEQERSMREESEGYNLPDGTDTRGESEMGDQDADGEADETGGYSEEADADDDGLEAELEMAMMESDTEEVSAPPVSTATPVLVTASSLTDNEAATPPMTTPTREVTDEESSGSEADASDDEIDEDAQEQQAETARQREEIADLESAIQNQSAELARIQNPILRSKVMKKIQSLQADLNLKRSAIGEGEEE